MQLLTTFFPQMENFETLIRKYRKGFEILHNENERLKNRVDSSNRRTAYDQGKIMGLEYEVNNLRGFIKTIPDYIKQTSKERHKNSRTGKER